MVNNDQKQLAERAYNTWAGVNPERRTEAAKAGYLAAFANRERRYNPKPHFSWAPIATHPREYVEKKMGHPLFIHLATKGVGSNRMEAFEAGEKSQVVRLKHLFKHVYRVLRGKGYSPDGQLLTTLSDYIREAETYEKREAERVSHQPVVKKREPR